MIDPIVSGNWLRANVDLVSICEVRPGGPSDPSVAFMEGHIPGAVLIDLDAVLADPPAPVVGRHPLPTPDAFARALGQAGIGNDATVVAYDDAGGGLAGRLVWMLRMIGQSAALLDGGLSSWTGALQHEAVTNEPVEREVVPWPADRLADSNDVAAHIEAGGTVVDSRSRERYLGETEPIDDVAGHVPGAINIPFTGNLDETGGFLPPDELASRFADLTDPDPIVYCGSGVTACHNALAMEAVGHTPPRVYVGSWSGWSTEPGRVIAVGDES